MASEKAILEAVGLEKRYGATVALQAVSFELYPGEVCGLLGENGAGKSTLVKILSGVLRPDSGDIRVGGVPYQPNGIVQARAAGMSTAFQELSLISTLSVAANLFLPRPAVNAAGLVSARDQEARALAVLQEYGITDLDPAEAVGDLPLGTRQRVEIVRALHLNPRVLLLDEPTAALSDREWLFRLIRQFVEKGSSVVYISHKIDEIRLLCKRCFILRNGKKVLDAPLDQMSDAEIFSNMAGRSAVDAYPEAQSSIRADQPDTLRVRDLQGAGVRGVSFALRAGEILGVAALEGQGQSALFKTLAGLSAPRGGSIETNGQVRHITSPRAALAAGMVLVPEERKTEGIFKDLSTVANISLPVIDSLTTLGWLRTGDERAQVLALAGRVDLDERYLDVNIEALSGGNQQKAVLARALISAPKCLLLFDPTRGVDVGTKQTIYKVLRDYVEQGGAVLLHSTELDELVHLSDRCLVIYNHTVVAEVPQDKLSQQHLLSLAMGYNGASGHPDAGAQAASTARTTS